MDLHFAFRADGKSAHRRGIAAVTFGFGGAAERARGQRLAQPAGAGRGIEDAQVLPGISAGARAGIQSIAGRARQLVHEALAHERVLRMPDGAPEAHRNVRVALCVLHPDVRDAVRQVVQRSHRLRVDTLGRRKRRLERQADFSVAATREYHATGLPQKRRGPSRG